MRLEHRRKDDAMEHDIVFSDEVNESGFRVFPPLFPASEALRGTVAQLFCVADVANRCIEPHIKHFTFSSLDRYGNAPIEVTCHGSRLKVHV